MTDTKPNQDDYRRALEAVTSISMDSLRGEPSSGSHVKRRTEVVALTGGPGDKCLSNGDSWEDSAIQTVDILCQCGWGQLSLPEAHVPAYCPECDFRFPTTPTEEG